MKLHKAHIQELYKFVRRHYVEHYDLQTELVDHLANGIETQWEENPKLSFIVALNNEFKKFGVFGFQDVISEKSQAMHKRYWKILISFYRDYFRFPKALILIGFSLFLYSILQSAAIEIARYIPGAILFIVLGVLLVKTLINRRKQKKKAKRWMLHDIIQFQGNSFGILNLVFQIAIYPGWIEIALLNTVVTFAVSFITVMFVIIIFIMVSVIPQKTEELMAETYPEYGIVD